MAWGTIDDEDDESGVMDVCSMGRRDAVARAVGNMVNPWVESRQFLTKWLKWVLSWLIRVLIERAQLRSDGWGKKKDDVAVPEEFG